MKVRFAITVFVVFATSLSGKSQQNAPATQPSGQQQEQLERQLERTLSNATLVGHYSVGEQDAPLKEDRYTLGTVKKMAGEMWLIQARIQFGQRDVTVPLMLPIRWAGDTPVICVTDMGVPGIGKYTARVMIYGDHYAGTWSGSANHQGMLVGRIEHAPTTQPAQAEKH
jgi:hypothetical protein